MWNGLHIDYFGNKNWYKNGDHHRLNGPAIKYMDGETHWWINGQTHRLDGPAIISSKGEKYWYYYNEYINVDNIKDFERIIKLLVLK